jgi:hemerythrin-like domain-containing protein
MDRLAAGLRYRVRRAARKIAEQHRHMAQLLRVFEETLADGAGEGAVEALGLYCGAVDAHFSLEDDVFFPALHGLNPNRGDALEALSREHAHYRAELEALRRSLEAGELPAFVGRFESFVQEVRRHEVREERLVSELTEPVSERA